MNKLTILVLAAGLGLAGCRGMESESPPIHPNLNMDFQQRYDPQEPSPFFADGRAMRVPVSGTVPRGLLRADEAFYAGRAGTAFVPQMPVPATRELLLRGHERYNIFCSPCHGRAGDGRGIVTTGGYGYTPAPSFHIDRLRQVEDGYLFDVITNGVRTMPPYNTQVPVADRWAIVAYVRALQRSQNASAADVPAEARSGLGQAPETGAAVDTTDAGTRPEAPAGDTTGAR